MLIDTHCHLHDREFFTAEQAEEMLARAHENGIEKIICIGTSHEDSLAARDFAEAHDNVFWTYGIHPEYASEESDQSFCNPLRSGPFAFGNSRPKGRAPRARRANPRAAALRNPLKSTFLIAKLHLDFCVYASWKREVLEALDGLWSSVRNVDKAFVNFHLKSFTTSFVNVWGFNYSESATLGR